MSKSVFPPITSVFFLLKIHWEVLQLQQVGYSPLGALHNSLVGNCMYSFYLLLIKADISVFYGSALDVHQVMLATLLIVTALLAYLTLFSRQT